MLTLLSLPSGLSLGFKSEKRPCLSIQRSVVANFERNKSIFQLRKTSKPVNLPLKSGSLPYSQLTQFCKPAGSDLTNNLQRTVLTLSLASDYEAEELGDFSVENQTTRCFVANLSFKVTWQELKDHFKQAGEVVYCHVFEDNEGRSRGMGVVEFANPVDARWAIENLSESDLLGRKILVREDQNIDTRSKVNQGVGFEQYEAKKRDRFAQYGDDETDVEKSARCFVANLSYEVTWQDLKDHFNQVGEVVYCHVFEDNYGRSRGMGVVEFASSEDTTRAIDNFSNTDMFGRTIYVREDQDEDSRSKTKPAYEEYPEESPGEGEDGFRNQWQATRVFVTNLDLEVDWMELKDFFKKAGTVVYASISCSNGRSKGCGIVQFETVEEAENAIRTLNHATLAGKEIQVRADRKTSKGGGMAVDRRQSNYSRAAEGGGGVLRDGGVQPQRKNPGGPQQWRKQGNASGRLFITNLDFNTDWTALKDHFKQAGHVSYARVLQDNDRRSRGMGVVEYTYPEDASNALRSMHETVLDGRTIFVREDIVHSNVKGGGGGDNNRRETRGGRGGFRGGGRSEGDWRGSRRGSRNGGGNDYGSNDSSRRQGGRDNFWAD